ncbi:transmembrane protein [Salix suchowensis]|nr:transmembrane protein [Salix suchowensis]
MGTCASVHNGSAPESAMKLGVSFSSKKDKLVTPESPINDNKHSAANPPIKTFGDFGSKEESFFDSRAWIDSDCEDDFYSVNGDFTPSRGNTPVHHNFAAGTPQANKNPLEGRPPGSELEPSPTGKKRLSDLFKDRIREDRDADALQTSGPGDQNIADGKVEVKQTILDVLPKSANTTLISPEPTLSVVVIGLLMEML